ncbi:MAG: transferase [Methylotenera sp.]|nr:MAG: transferase [Methylotenera sp.]
MIRKIKDHYWSYWLSLWDCKLATKVSNLSETAIVQMEEHVKLGSLQIHSGHYSFGAFTYMRSGGELYGNTTIGRFCSIGRGVVIGLEKNKHPTDWLSTSLFSRSLERKYESIAASTQTVIGHDCWIGQEAIIMSGVNIGHGAIIGARALVTSNVPPFAIYGGIPAKLIRYRFPIEIINKLINVEWWNMRTDYLEKLNMDNPELCIQEIEHSGVSAHAEYKKIAITRQRGCLVV